MTEIPFSPRQAANFINECLRGDVTWKNGLTSYKGRIEFTRVVGDRFEVIVKDVSCSQSDAMPLTRCEEVMVLSLPLADLVFTLLAKALVIRYVGRYTITIGFD